MSPTSFAGAVRKDFERLLADPLALLLDLSLPVLIGCLLMLVFSSGGGSRGLVLLADEDNSLLGRFISGGVQQDQVSNWFSVERVTTEAGRARMQRGEATALIVLPKGTTTAILDESPATITLVTNPAQRVLPGIVKEGLQLLVESLFYMQQLFGGPIRSFRASREDGSGIFPDASVATLSTAINQRIRQMDGVVFPPVLELSGPSNGPSDTTSGTTGFGRLLLPGLIFMSMLFLGQGFANDLWEEQSLGTLRRVASAPAPIWIFLAAKLVAATVLIGVVSLVALSVGVVLFGVPAARALSAVPWCVFGGVALLCLLQLPTLFASTRRGANLMTSMAIFPLMMLGGSFFPFETMPEWMARLGRWTPNGQAVARLKDLLGGTATLGSMAIAALAVGLSAVLAFAASAKLVRHRIEKGW